MSKYYFEPSDAIVAAFACGFLGYALSYLINIGYVCNCLLTICFMLLGILILGFHKNTKEDKLKWITKMN